jgi:hypothetical protein
MRHGLTGSQLHPYKYQDWTLTRRGGGNQAGRGAGGIYDMLVSTSACVTVQELDSCWTVRGLSFEGELPCVQEPYT